MDLSILAGFAAGLAILALALGLAHVPMSLVINPEAVLLVVLGTFIATLAGTGWGNLKSAIGMLLSKGGPEGQMKPEEALAYSMDVVTFVREESILALQPMVDGVEYPFFRKGLQFLLDNRTERFIRESLGMEMEMFHRQKLDDARIFETAAGYSPTMGVIGAVIGLVCVLQNMSAQNPMPLGQSVAGAFVATLYGVAFANLFLLPAASKLRQRAREEWRIRSLFLEAIIGIHTSEHPLLLQERLGALIADARRDTHANKASKLDLDAPLPEQDMEQVRTMKTGSHITRPKAKMGKAASMDAFDIRPAHTVMDDDFLRVR